VSRFADQWKAHQDYAILEQYRKRSLREIPTATIEVEQEDDGRWIAEAPDLPGVIAYGATEEETLCRVKVLASRVMADRLEHGEELPELASVFAVAS
jgi:predicted RNase H-like HicB family nuclease